VSPSTNEINQSHHYQTYQEWIDKFLKPSVYGVLELLTDNGTSCWSVKNFKTDKNYHLYNDIVKLHLDKNWILIDTQFYVGNPIRPGSKDTSKEITYIFKRF